MDKTETDMSQVVNGSYAPPIPVNGKSNNAAVNQMAKELIEQKRNTEAIQESAKKA